MTKAKIAHRPLNSQALAIEESEAEIRRLVKDNFFLRGGKYGLDKTVESVINDTLKRIQIPILRDAAKRSLFSFYRRQYHLIRAISAAVLYTFLCTKKVQGEEEYTRGISMTRAKEELALTGKKSAVYGVPLQTYQEELYKEKIKPVLDRLKKEKARDPDDKTGHNTLRNRAEMEVRYAHNQGMLDGLRSAGVRLVVCSSHADASARCRPWQGRVYSLDGTSGRSPDGRSFVPIEEATDIYYTTAAGITYKNGLLGFNCRHFLIAYEDGLRFNSYDEAMVRREYKITLKQREMERRIRDAKTEAIEFRGVDDERYKRARDRAAMETARYKAFSRNNGRAFFLSRIDI